MDDGSEIDWDFPADEKVHVHRLVRDAIENSGGLSHQEVCAAVQRMAPSGQQIDAMEIR